MTPALLVIATWILFGGSHLLMATDPLRARLVERFGRGGFVTVFSAAAAMTFSLFVVTAASTRQHGVPGLALGDVVLIRSLAVLAIAVGFALAAGSLSSYSRSPMAVFSSGVGAIRGVHRISRHAFFYGLALVAAAHVLVVPTLAAAAFFACLGVQAVFGAWLQDRKLATRYGQPYRDYIAATSAIPLGAILRGRQQLAPSEQPWMAYAVGVVLAFALSRVHESLFDFHGLWIVTATLGGAAFATLSATRAQRTETT